MQLKKKALLLLLTVVLVFSCKQEEVLDQNNGTADLTADISQYDTSNLGLYKGTFTTLDASERGILEVKIIANAPSRATLTLSSGASYALQSTSVVASNEVTNLRFAIVADTQDSVSFDLSVNADGTNIEISNTILGSKESHIVAAKETSRGPVVPIAGSFDCTDCGTTNWTSGQTWNLLFLSDPSGSGPGTIVTVFTLNGVVFASANNSQDACVTNGDFNECGISGFTTITNNMTWSGTHIYNNTAVDCSQANGTWAYDSPTFGSLAGTFTSDTQCVSPGTPAAIGDLREGGVVFWVDPVDNTHGLVCALSDSATTVEWGCFGNDLPSVPNVFFIGGVISGPGAEIGDGMSNTNGILTDCPTAPAALAARSNGPEWFLPSAKELNEIYDNKATLEAVTGFTSFSSTDYWSSSEYDSDYARLQYFLNGGQTSNFKDDTAPSVRAVRAF